MSQLGSRHYDISSLLVSNFSLLETVSRNASLGITFRKIHCNLYEIDYTARLKISHLIQQNIEKFYLIFL